MRENEIIGHWSARAIYRGRADNYFVDILADRQSHSNSSDELMAWVRKDAMPWLRKAVKEHGLSPSESKRISFRHGVFEMSANTNASYGYLYIVAMEFNQVSAEAEHAACDSTKTT